MAVNVFDVMSLSKARIFDPGEVGYEDSVDIIKEESVKIQKSFVKIGWYLKHIQDNELYREDGYSNINECAAEQFGYSQSTVSRFIGICEKFSKDHNSPELDEKYAGFDKSQMIEMLPMEQEQLERVSPDMTVKEIRDIKNENRNGPDDGEIRVFCKKILSDLSVAERNDLKKYMILHYGSPHVGGSGGGIDYRCSPKGIWINDSEEITWAQFVKRVKELEELEPGSCLKVKKASVEDKADNDIPGQTSIEGDFPEYLPEEPSEEKYATSHNEIPKENPDISVGAEDPEDKEGGVVVDSNYVEISSDPVQPELPVLKNNNQRKEWLGNYKEWGLWYRDENIDVNYYKFDFEDGSRLVVAEYPQRYSYWNGNREDEFSYHLLEKNKQGYGKISYDESFRNITDSETYLVEFLKKVQKRG